MRSQTDEMLAAKHDPEPWLWPLDGTRNSIRIAPEAIFDPRVEVIPSRDTGEHRPIDWFTVGRYPSCSCGVDPHDNGVLVRHWADNGVQWVDVHGTLTAFAARPPVNPILVEFRADDADETWPEKARGWLNGGSTGDGYATAEQINHAYRVLTRLAALA